MKPQEEELDTAKELVSVRRRMNDLYSGYLYRDCTD